MPFAIMPLAIWTLALVEIMAVSAYVICGLPSCNVVTRIIDAWIQALVRQASINTYTLGNLWRVFFYWKTFYLVVATDCKRYLTGPKDLLNNYTDPMGQLDNYADSKASKNQRSSKWPLIFSSEYWLFRPTKISIYLARPEEPVNNIFWSVVQHDMLWPVTTTKSNIP